MFRSLRSRLTVIFVGLAVIPLLALTAFLAQRSFSALQQDALDDQANRAALAATKIQDFILERENELRLLTEVGGLNDFSQTEQRSMLEGLLVYGRAYNGLTILDSAGTEQFRLEPDRTYIPDQLTNRLHQPEFQIPVSTGEIYYSPVYFDDEFGEPLMTIALPLVDLQTNQVVAVFVADFRFKRVWELIADINLEGDEDIYVVDSQGRVIAHQNPSIVLGNTIFDLPEEDGKANGLAGTDVYLAMKRLAFGDQELVVVSEQPIGEALESAVNSLYVTVAIATIALLAAIGLVFLTVRQVVRPIESLSAVAQQIREGNLELRADVRSDGEIGELASSFNSMTNQLQELIGSLEERVQARTRDLRVAADVSRQTTTILDLNVLLPELVDQVKTGFGMYHIGIFLYDADRDILSLKAAAGDTGRRMVADRLEFHIDAPSGVIAKAGRERQPVIINDVSQSPIFISNPNLPDTRSEAVLPMTIGSKLIGVLDLQSDVAGRFASEERDILITLAEQIGIAVRNAQLFEDAEAARAEAEQANELKSRFLANMSHELRTPLNAILNYTSFVAKGVMGPVNGKQEEMLLRAAASGKHLLSLINDVLDITKIESGMMEFFVQEVDFNAMLSATESIAKGLVKDKSLQLIVDIDDDLPTSYGDQRRLSQVFLNLISNAVKFTPEGSVTLKAFSRNNKVYITVADTGIGIAPEDHHLVFESFKQIKHELSETVGTGLGMPISKFFVELHAGRIWIDSELGKGASFHIELPILTQEEAYRISETSTAALEA